MKKKEPQEQTFSDKIREIDKKVQEEAPKSVLFFIDALSCVAIIFLLLVLLAVLLG